jgi:ABC-type uncharacterized transport system substrate-binding protein
MPAIGILDSASAESRGEELAAFHRGLREAGHVEGQDFTIKYRPADNDFARLPALAAELVRDQVAVIVAAGGPRSALAAKEATKTIPIVFTTVADPVKSGLVAGLERPGGNLTGTAGLTSELDAARLELMHRLLLDQPKRKAGPIGVLRNPDRPEVGGQSRELDAAAKTIGRQLIFQDAGTEREIDAAFATLAGQRVDALLVTASSFFSRRRAQVIALAEQHRFPAIYQWREFVAAGGLMSYGPSIMEAYQQAGSYAGRILKGAKPADLPVMKPTWFELAINFKTAKALGLDIPSTLHVNWGSSMSVVA